MVYVSSNASFFNFCVWIILVDKWMMCALSHIAVDVSIFIDFSVYKRHKSITDDIFILLSFCIPLIQKKIVCMPQEYDNVVETRMCCYCYELNEALVSRVK